jgi:hypothetical protein
MRRLKDATPEKANFFVIFKYSIYVLFVPFEKLRYWFFLFFICRFLKHIRGRTSVICLLSGYAEAESKKKHGVQYGTLCRGADYNLTLCSLQSRLQHIYHGHCFGQLYSRVDFVSLVRDLGHGFCFFNK